MMSRHQVRSKAKTALNKIMPKRPQFIAYSIVQLKIDVSRNCSWKPKRPNSPITKLLYHPNR